MRIKMIARATLLALGLGLALGACSYTGAPTNIFEQRLTWFSYMAGDDIRAACAPGTPDRYRFVYNAVYGEQARAYDVVALTGGGAVMRQQVDRGLVIDVVPLQELFQLGVPDRTLVELPPEALAELERRMADSGVVAPPPVGLRLHSRGFFWIVTGCRDGDYFLTAYRHPSERFQEIRFDEFLFRADRTGIAVRRPGGAADFGHRPGGPGCGSVRPEDREPCFTLQVGEDGLVDLATIF